MKVSRSRAHSASSPPSGSKGNRSWKLERPQIIDQVAPDPVGPPLGQKIDFGADGEALSQHSPGLLDQRAFASLQLPPMPMPW